MTSRLSRLVVAVVTVAFCGGVDPSEGAVVAGRVVSAGERPVEHARIEVPGGTSPLFSDPDGRFELEDVDLPVTLVVSHPRFESETRILHEATDDLVVILRAKQAVYETIAVSANRGRQNFAPVSVASSVIEPAEATTPVTNVGELLAQTAAVSENGQGGAFQTFSIRGVSRQRVLTLVSGMRMVSERRAGVSASFVDPLLLGAIDVVRGPSSTYYGSGALGGVVQLFSRHFDRLTVASGLSTQGDEGHLLVAGGSV
jgi:outer membrane receptor protein involved in Fe transport